MSEWVIATFIVFLASVMQAATGFGFSIMATPFLLLVFSSHDAIQINIVISLFISMALTPKIWKEIDSVLLKRLVLGSFMGIPLGAYFFANFNIFLLKIIVGVVILVLTTCLVCRNVPKESPGETEDVDPCIKNQPNTTNHSKRNDMFVGLCAGILTASIGMPGPPLLLYFNAKCIKKEVLRSTSLAFFIFVYIVSLIFQVVTVDIKPTVLTSSLLLFPVVVLGMFIGSILFKWINQRMFHFITLIILAYTGIYLLIKTLW